MVIGKLLGFDAHCVAWTNKFFDREKSKPNIDGACITLRQKTIDVPFRPREEHSIILLTSGCGKLKSYIGIDNGFLGGSDGLFEWECKQTPMEVNYLPLPWNN